MKIIDLMKTGLSRPDLTTVPPKDNFKSDQERADYLKRRQDAWDERWSELATKLCNARSEHYKFLERELQNLRDDHELSNLLALILESLNEFGSPLTRGAGINPYESEHSINSYVQSALIRYRKMRRRPSSPGGDPKKEG